MSRWQRTTRPQRDRVDNGPSSVAPSQAGSLPGGLRTLVLRQVRGGIVTARPLLVITLIFLVMACGETVVGCTLG